MPHIIVSIAADHRGFLLKSNLSDWLLTQGGAVIDCGAEDEARCDAGDYALRVVDDLRHHPDHRGVLICGSGQAMAMTANRFAHIRAALCMTPDMARLARQHNDANILVLAADFIDPAAARQCLDIFLKTEFLGGRYAERLLKLAQASQN